MKCDYPSPEVLNISLTSQLGCCSDGSLQRAISLWINWRLFFTSILIWESNVPPPPPPAYSIFSTGVFPSEDRSPQHLLTTVRWRTTQNADNLQCLLVEERALLSSLEALWLSVRVYFLGLAVAVEGLLRGWGRAWLCTQLWQMSECELQYCLAYVFGLCWGWDPTKRLLQGKPVLSPLSERRWASVALNSGAGGKHGQHILNVNM